MKRLTEWDANKELLVKEEERLLNTKGVITKDEMYKIMRHLAEKLADYEDKEEQGLLLELPVAIGATVYVISKCSNVESVMDGDFETATGYYCPFELNSQCPHDCDDCEDVKNELAVFEDTIHYIGYDETGTHLFTRYTAMCCTIGKDAFFTREEAEEALAKMGGTNNG